MDRFRLLVLAAFVAAGCSSSSGVKGGATGNPAAPPAASAASPPAAAATPPTAAPAGKVHKLASGLVYEDLVVGNGKMADPGLTVAVNYTGWFTDGTKFDSSFDRGKPITFTLGAGEMIAGWDQGIKGMRIGGKRKLTIPPDMAYGSEGRPPRIPPNSTLVFEVELLGVH